MDATVVLPRTSALAASPAPVQRLPIDHLETVIIPKFEDRYEPPPSIVDLAKRYGLKPASARPKPLEYLRQLWKYREFIATYANGRAIATYGQARLGRLWQVIGPLLNAGVYFLIFGLILDLSRGMENFVAYLTIGVFTFTYIQLVVQTSVNSISGQLGLVRAMQFPRASLPIAFVIMNMQTAAISFVVLGVIVALTGEPVTIEWAWVVPAFALQTLFGMGLALAVARMGAKLPDVKQIVPHVMRIWFYASGVFYSVDYFTRSLPEALANVVRANPMLTFIELMRYSLMETAPIASSFTQLWVMAGAWAAVAAVGGYIYFWRGEPDYGRG